MTRGDSIVLSTGNWFENRSNIFVDEEFAILPSFGFVPLNNEFFAGRERNFNSF